MTRSTAARRATTLVIILSIVGCRDGASPPEAPGGTVWFEEGAAAAGLQFVHDSGANARRLLMPEIMVGGVCLLDYDGDDALDVYFVQAGAFDSVADRPGNQLFRNRGDGTFEDVTARSGVGDTGFGMGCACGDYDADGDVDLYVTNVGPNVLYRNDGDGTFTDVTAVAGVGDPGWSASAGFVDHDGDGFLDLFVTNYIRWSPGREIDCTARGLPDYCSPKSYQAPAPDTLYRNVGDGRFEDVTGPAGLGLSYGNGLGVAFADFDGDGRQDLYVANDGTPNQLWINGGEAGFTDEAVLRGCAVNAQGMSEAGMGVAALDLGADGRMDLFMSHLNRESNTFYRNRDGYFDDVSAAMGLGGPSRPYTGFGLGFADFDHDGHLDVFIANGRVGRGTVDIDPDDPYAEPDQLLRGREDGAFEEVLPRGGVDPPLIATSRGAAFGDLDGDGDVDIVVVNRDAPAHLLWNTAGDDDAWIQFRVLDERGVDAIGAVLRIVTGTDRRPQARPVQVAASYCASSDPRVHFGLGGGVEQIDEVEVRWPDGTVERFGARARAQVHELRRGAGTTDHASP